MLNPEGWVTRAIGAIRREAHWTTYYKLIERAQVPVTELSLRLLQLVLTVYPAERVTLILDDTQVPRCVKFGPGISFKHDHSHKANRPTFLNSQCWVTLALVVRVRLGSALTMPIRSWLLEQQVRIIGQVRRDTALFLPPEPEPKRRGRKRKYGLRIDAVMLETLPVQERELMLYGKVQPVRVRSVLAVARFLKGLPVRAVWCEMLLPNHTWSRPRLILATETDLSAQQVVEIYAERWGIEPLFHNLKRWWGVANLWQQSKAALELWMQIRSTAYALTQLLALQLGKSFPLMAIAPWRKGAMITAGLFAQWLRMQFIGLPVRDAYDPKSGQFVMPFPGKDQRLQC